MRGDDRQQQAMFSYLSPEERVPEDHPLRIIRPLVDEVLREPLGGAHRDPPAMAQTLGAALQRVLLELEAIPTDELVARRDARLAAFGVYSESPP